jgi:sec-independent protein translocase protein TatB
MFDIGASELLMIVIVAVVVIGPKDMPLALRTAGRWIGKMRKVSGHFRAGIDAMVREAELEDLEKKWRAQNDAIMKAHPHVSPADGGPEMAPLPAPTAESRIAESLAEETPLPVDFGERPDAGPEPGPPEPVPASAEAEPQPVRVDADGPPPPP